ncbi:MAG: V-type ATP synthase subunit E, partial [Candidatus Omnitrophota bacterium]
VFTPELLKEVILRLVEAFKKNDTAEVEVMVSEKDKQALESFFSAKLKEEILKGVTIKISANMENGLRIGEKGQNAYYDFTDEAIAEAFTAFLTPKMAGMTGS